MAEQYEKVQFKTLDGIFLRGRLYPAAQRGPAVILSPGVRILPHPITMPMPPHYQLSHCTVQRNPNQLPPRRRNRAPKSRNHRARLRPAQHRNQRRLPPQRHQPLCAGRGLLGRILLPIYTGHRRRQSHLLLGDFALGGDCAECSECGSAHRGRYCRGADFQVSPRQGGR
jgi:hypothetical protein